MTQLSPAPNPMGLGTLVACRGGGLLEALARFQDNRLPTLSASAPAASSLLARLLPWCCNLGKAATAAALSTLHTRCCDTAAHPHPSSHHR